MSKHHFIVVYDSETKSFSVDPDTSTRFPNGTIWVSDATTPYRGRWVAYDDSGEDARTTELSYVDCVALGHLVGMFLVNKDETTTPVRLNRSMLPHRKQRNWG